MHKQGVGTNDWSTEYQGPGGLHKAPDKGRRGAQQGIASMGAGGSTRDRVPPKMQDTVNALLGQVFNALPVCLHVFSCTVTRMCRVHAYSPQLEKQNAQPRKDEILPAIIAAAVLLSSALYPLLRPVVSLFESSQAQAEGQT